MPLRDHFRPPLDDVHSWSGLHGGWPAVMIQQLNKGLPEQYFCAPTVHLGTIHGCDSTETRNLEPLLQGQDVYEVRIYERRRKRELVAAIEIVSPSNKDRPAHRLAFVSKVADLLAHGICVSIIDVVTTSNFNLYAELMDTIDGLDPNLGNEPSPIYAVTMRARHEGTRKLMDNWYYPLQLGHALPTLPTWLTSQFAVPLDLEASYEDACRALRIR